MLDQQHFMSFVHKATTKYILQQKLNTGMVIIGKVVGNVEIKDLARIIHHGATAHITEFEINKSKDLQTAIRRGWVEIVEDRGAIHRAIVTSSPAVIQQTEGFNKEEILSLAKQMAQDMASQMLKSNELVMNAAKDIAKDMAKEMVKELNLNIQSIQAAEKKDEKLQLEDSKPENVFIDVDEKKEAKIEVGTVRETANLNGSLEKMKRFKRKKENTE